MTTPANTVDGEFPRADGFPEFGERVVAATALAVTLALRIAYVARYRLDSDEPQHLHVVWGWTLGLLPYRDVFDNHAPLFHIALAPLAFVLGERPDLMLWMRAAMLPLTILMVWSTYEIGRACFSGRAGLWAAVLLGLVPRFFMTSVEFRADTLWATFWLLALVVLFRDGMRPAARGFLTGLGLGAALAVSLKSVLLLCALGTAGLLLITRPETRARLCRRKASALAAVSLLGFLTPALLICAYFASRNALAPLAYGTVGHNLIGAFGLTERYPMRVFIFPAALPLGWLGMQAGFASTPSVSRGTRRALVFLVAVFYLAALHAFWPLETKQDYQPWWPLFVVVVTGVGFTLREQFSCRRRGQVLSYRYAAILGAIAIGEAALLLRGVSRGSLHGRVDPGLPGDVLRLTRPDDFVMDAKGETVFRRRPFYYALESVTLERMRRGLISDTIPERLVRTRTCVAVTDLSRFPPRARAFIERNYIAVGRLRVVGQELTLRRALRGGISRITFHVTIAAPYAIVTPRHPALGWLDGTPYDGARSLAAGRHVFRVASSEGPLALVWAPAIERGFSPLWRDGS